MAAHEPTLPPAKGHLLTDAVATHAAFPPVALVTVKLILRGLRHQADAEAVSVGRGEAVGTGAVTLTQDTPRHPFLPPQSVPASERPSQTTGENLPGDQASSSQGHSQDMPQSHPPAPHAPWEHLQALTTPSMTCPLLWAFPLVQQGELDQMALSSFVRFGTRGGG